MKKILFICTCLTLLILLLSLVIDEKSESYSKKIGENFKATLVPMSSESYAELVENDRENFEEYEDFYYFFLRISETEDSQSQIFKELHSRETIGKSINYLSHEIANDLVLIAGSDTLNCAMAHWERTYNIRKDLTLSVAFHKETKEKPTKLIWNDNLFEGIPLKFKLN